jgi:hypothetical protein
LMMVVKTGEKERVILKYDPYGKMTPNEPYWTVQYYGKPNSKVEWSN